MIGLSHENIVEFLGFVEDIDNGNAWILLSWEPNGNVSEFLATGNWEIPERISLVSDYQTGKGSGSELTICSCQIQDTFEGLHYLHTRRPPICHGDLKSVG